MDKITIDATVDSMIGVNLERKEKNINHSNVPLRGIYDFEIDNVDNESMLKAAILKSIKKLSVSNKILLNGWIDIIHKGRRVYRATFYRLSVKDIIDGEYTK